MRIPSRPRWSSALTLALLATFACESTDDALDKAEKATRNASQKAYDASKDKAGELAGKAGDKALELGNDAVDASKKKAGELGDQAAAKATELGNDAVDASKEKAGELADDALDATKKGVRALYDDLRNDGELSQSAKAWFKEHATSASIEDIVTKGVQLAPVALEASRVLSDAVESDVAVEPIFQKIDEDTAKVDAAIGDMPRVEVVNDVTVGFKQMDQLDAHTDIKQRAYLVMWRHEGHLLGFVYRSTRTIDVDKLVAETPRLIRLSQAALED
ncbi:MAG: hypothetical protein AAF799_21900 [Myxococcota bacterium]